MFARTGVPADTIREMQHVIARAMQSGEMRSALEVQGIAPMSMSPAAFDAFVRDEIKRWQTVVAAVRK
ncbi:Tripartite tricarboxylate transporter family receptor [compost metagenome]